MYHKEKEYDKVRDMESEMVAIQTSRKVPDHTTFVKITHGTIFILSAFNDGAKA